jgi:Flp pilus assembly protein TadB
MPAQPASRADPQRSSESGAQTRRPSPATLERRKRERHLRRRRRDLLEDFALALLLMTVVLMFTAGLGVIALLDIVLIAVLTGSYLLRRWMRSRR